MNTNNSYDEKLNVVMGTLVLLQKSKIDKAMILLNKIQEGFSNGIKYESENYYIDPVEIFYPDLNGGNKLVFHDSKLLLHNYRIFAKSPFDISGDGRPACIELESYRFDFITIDKPVSFDPMKIVDLILMMNHNYQCIVDNAVIYEKASSMLQNYNDFRRLVLTMK